MRDAVLTEHLSYIRYPLLSGDGILLFDTDWLDLGNWHGWCHCLHYEYGCQ